MQRVSGRIVLVGLLVAGLGGLQTAHAQSAAEKARERRDAMRMEREQNAPPKPVFVPPVRYEYSFYEAYPLDTPQTQQEKLNALGMQGWQVVAVYPVPASMRYVLMRALPAGS